MILAISFFDKSFLPPPVKASKKWWRAVFKRRPILRLCEAFGGEAPSATPPLKFFVINWRFPQRRAEAQYLSV
jgi:hypothetical protein